MLFQSLLVSGRPEVLIHYEQHRRQLGLTLSVPSHNRVLEAYASLFSAQELMLSLRDWVNECRPLGAPTPRQDASELLLNPSAPLKILPRNVLDSLHSRRTKPSASTRPPDGRTYSLIINFFSSNPHLLSKSMLADLFEFIQIDRVVPRELQILKLFQLTKYLKSPVLANEMLRWFCGMSVE
jgi:hypothetical protein